jgi:hypothetical protein
VTVGWTSIEKPEPFHGGRWNVAQNGTVPDFDTVRLKSPEHMDPRHRAEVCGTRASVLALRCVPSLRPWHNLEPLQRAV